MTIRNDGNIGIGTNDPQQNLSVFAGLNIDQGDQNTGVLNSPDIGSAGGEGLSFGNDSGEGIASQRTSSTTGNQYDLLFFTDFTPRMCILNNGAVGIGTTAPDALLSVNGTADKAGGGSWSTFSDRRLKDVGPQFTPGLEALEEIQPVHYHYKSDNPLQLPSEPEYVGVVAQQVQSAVPEAVQQNNDGYLVVNNDPIIWTMLNGIKELNQRQKTEDRKKDAEIQDLKRQNDSLTERLNELETTVKLLAARK
jgi:hypothetical protein